MLKRVFAGTALSSLTEEYHDPAQVGAGCHNPHVSHTKDKDG